MGVRVGKQTRSFVSKSVAEVAQFARSLHEATFATRERGSQKTRLRTRCTAVLALRRSDSDTSGTDHHHRAERLARLSAVASKPLRVQPRGTAAEPDGFQSCSMRKAPLRQVSMSRLEPELRRQLQERPLRRELLQEQLPPEQPSLWRVWMKVGSWIESGGLAEPTISDVKIEFLGASLDRLVGFPSHVHVANENIRKRQRTENGG